MPGGKSGHIDLRPREEQLIVGCVLARRLILECWYAEGTDGHIRKRSSITALRAGNSFQAVNVMSFILVYAKRIFVVDPLGVAELLTSIFCQV